jgi:hypothetical protein
VKGTSLEEVVLKGTHVQSVDVVKRKTADLLNRVSVDDLKR